ncbi:MAG: hypothetical protein Q8P20_00465 [bacterium]|nr:hypothetical protein [bacterium]
MIKIKRDMSTAEKRKWWLEAEKIATQTQEWSDWKNENGLKNASLGYDCELVNNCVLSPLTEALYAITGVNPPIYTYGIFSISELENRIKELQEWCEENANPPWASGTSILNAAELLINSAVTEFNIYPKGQSHF